MKKYIIFKEPNMTSDSSQTIKQGYTLRSNTIAKKVLNYKLQGKKPLLKRPKSYDLIVIKNPKKPGIKN